MEENLYPWAGKPEDESVRPDGGATFHDVVIERRALLGGALAAGMVAATFTGEAKAADAVENEAFLESGITFDPIPNVRVNTQDFIDVPANYNVSLVIRWGDPMSPGAPLFDGNNHTAAAQAGQSGYNHDFIGYFPLPDWRSQNSQLGVMGINFEYTNPELMFMNFNATNPTREQVDIQIAAHGVGFVEVQRMPNAWVNVVSPLARRITGETMCEITGPAAGDDWMKTSYDSTGTRVRGTLNNCAGGKTPWGTFLTAEENFNQYFANRNNAPAGAIRDAHARMGIPTGASGYLFERFHDRFDTAKEPNEPFRFGWVVEIDPYNPNTMPKKRTALGRAKNENATVTLARDNRAVVYKGDDERFEYVYKFVTRDRFNPENRAANMDLLDNGTLYVARYNADGTGVWLPLVFGQGPLVAPAFRSQADVLIRARQASDLLGATRMDRPEDIETNPVTKKVYGVFTSNTNRAVGTNPGTDAANPRANNRWGHIIEMIEAGGDNAATSFAWNIFMVCGDPAVASQRTFFAGWTGPVSTISTPDNITFDNRGNMWILTDGMESSINMQDGIFACPTEGPERGWVRRFASVPAGAECCGGEFTPDNNTVFLAVQHPGEGGTRGGTVVSRWPDGTDLPKPAVVAITKAPGTGSPIIGTK
jgi:secreted PhoX family phosphatase